MTKDTSLELQKEIAPIVSHAKSLVIKDEKTMLESVELLSQCNINLDRAEAEKETIITPAKAIIKRETARWAPVIDPLKEAVQIIRTEQSRYQTEASRIAKIEQDLVIARIGQGKGKLKVETALKKMEDIKSPEDKVTSTSGSVKFRDHPILKIKKLSDIPFEYFDLNESKVMNALKAGIEVPGAEIEIVKIPVNRR